MTILDTLTFHVRRYSKDITDDSEFTTYEVPYQAGMSVMDALHYAQRNIDTSLAFDCSCRIGICKACALRMDGAVVMACSTVAREGMRLEPVNTKDVRRDLIVRPAIYHQSVSEILSDLGSLKSGKAKKE